MSDYPPYSGPAVCPKCGDEVGPGTWTPRSTRFLLAAGKGRYYANQTGDEEWMLRECRCGYCWPEQLPVEGKPQQ